MSSTTGDRPPLSHSLATSTAARTLTTWKIIVLIIAAFAPIITITTTLPLGLAFGGPTMALAFAGSGVIIGLFTIGYAQMVRRITRPGAFYNYIARGLGRPFGVGGAMIGVVSYTFGMMAAYPTASFVIAESLQSLGLEVAWQWCYAGLVLITATLVWRQIDISAMISGVIFALSMVVIAAFLTAIVLEKGLDAFPTEIMSPAVFSYGDWTVSFIFAFLVYQSFEAGALYAPEAIRPERTVPRALFGSLVIATGTFLLLSWVLSSFSAPADLMATVEKQGIVRFVFQAVGTYLGPAGLWLFSLLAGLSAVISALALTNFIARYISGIAGDSLIPSYLARLNRHGAPARSAYMLIALACAAVIACQILGIDPLTQLAPVSLGFGAIGSTMIQLISSAAVVGFFLRQPKSEQHWWFTFTAPVLATILLAVALMIILNGFVYITGTSQPWTAYLPWIVITVFVFGVFFGLWLKRARPEIYAGIAAGDSAEDAAELRARRVLDRQP